MADTNIRLLATKIESLDAPAQHAVEIAVDSLLDGAGPAPNRVVDSRIAMLERRVNALGDPCRNDDIVLVDARDREQSDLRSAIEYLIEAAHRTLHGLGSADVAQHAR